MAVGSNLPVFGDICGPVFRDFPADTMRPGDLYWYNDCYGSRGAISHSNDQVLVAPVFQTASVAASSWAGRISPTSAACARDRSAPTHRTSSRKASSFRRPSSIDAGTTNEATLKIFFRNSRFPEQNMGDMRALMASAALGVKRIEEIVARFGAELVADALSQLVARTRKLVRTKLAETFGYGTHKFTDAIDSDGHGNGPFHLRLALTREKGKDGEDKFIFDATATDDQSPGPVNLLLNPDVPGTALSMFYLGGDPAQVCNAGGPQALDEVKLREGSLLWPKWPAPLGMRGLTLMRFLAAVNGLINVAGGKAPAAHSAYVISFLRGTYRTLEGKLEPFLMSDGIGVGWGARATADGPDAVYFVAQENYPVEFLETGYPVRLQDLRHPRRLVRRRPLARRLRHRARVRHPCGGGDAGDPHRQREEPALGHRRRHGGRDRPRRRQSRLQPRAHPAAALSDGNMLQRGDVLRIETGGGGGYGHPFDRSPQSVLDDVLGGFVTARVAQELYGVAIDEDTVDDTLTRKLRAKRPEVKAFSSSQGLCRPSLILRLIPARSPSPSISAALSPTSPCTTLRAAASGAPRRRPCRAIPRRPS